MAPSREPRNRCYAILGIHKLTGQYVAEVEKSLSMALARSRVCAQVVKRGRGGGDNRLAPLWRHCAELDVKFPEYKFKVVRLGSKSCPIKVHWVGGYMGRGNYAFSVIDQSEKSMGGV